jgi:23S rRNA U2552 (ribose-2'-O)-methylase RlmE/FtsJ
MEKAQQAKPPWIQPQWQRRQKTTPLPEELSFAPWQADSSPELQAAKERISALEATNRWELVKKMVNPYEMVYTHEDPYFHPSIAVIKPLSRSYFKLIEMMYVLQFFERLPKQAPKIRTAHVAEGPGGFIQAVAELAERNKKILHQATAMTLKPTDQRVPGWRRASTFLHHHREVRLHYGIDGTGDVYNTGNQDSFVNAVTPGVNLFTADGGFDFSINYDIQEQHVYNLLVCSASIGLRSLMTDGSFVLKLFDIFSQPSIILIGLMARCFSEWTLYKPALSRPCNSERYFLGRGFRGTALASVIKHLAEIQKQAQKGLYPTDAESILTAEELAYIRTHIVTNTSEQMAAISVAEKYAIHPEVWYSTQLQRDFNISLGWCQRFRVPYTATAPTAVRQAVYTSLLNVSPQSQLLGGDSSSPDPSGPALPTSSVDLSGHIVQAVLPSQTDSDSLGRTQGPAP